MPPSLADSNKSNKRPKSARPFSSLQSAPFKQTGHGAASEQLLSSSFLSSTEPPAAHSPLSCYVVTVNITNGYRLSRILTNRLMVKVRRVYVVTSNPERVPEFQKLMQHYGIEVKQASPYGYRTKKLGPKALLPLVAKLLSHSTDEFWTKSVMYEKVLLLCYGSDEHADAPGRDFVDGGSHET